MVPILVVLSLGCIVSVVLGQTSVSIEGGGRVEVGDNVSIICLCTGDFNCYSHGVVFRISGRDYTKSQLKEHAPQYSIQDGDISFYKQEVILTLTQATLDNDGTTYKCKIFPNNWDQANMVTLSVIEHGSVQNSSQSTVATNITATTTTMSDTSDEVTSSTTRSDSGVQETKLRGHAIASSVNPFSMVILPTTTTTTTTTTATTTANMTMELERTHVIESTPLDYIVTSTEILRSTGFSLLQTVVTSTTTIMTTTTTTAAATTTATATPRTPVDSVPLTMPPETEEPTLKSTSEKATEPVKEDDAPTYVYVAVGSGVGIVVYILTIVLIGLVISLKIKAKKAARRGSGISPSLDNECGNEYPVSIPMVSNPVYSEVVSPSGPAPPYFKVDPCQFGDRHIVVNMDTRYHDVPQRKSVAAESLYDYIDMQ